MAGGLSLWVLRVAEDGRTYEVLLPSGGWDPMEPGAYHAPTLHLADAAASDLATDLDAEGVLPEHMRQVAGRLAAQSAHLEDLRKIVAAQLGVRL